MKNRILSILLSVCMVMTILPTMALAVESPQARWGLAGEGGSAPTDVWVGSGTLDAAMEYAKNLNSGTAYIQLLSNVNTTAPLFIYAGRTTILDLYGHVINRELTQATSNGNVITVYGTLTLKNSSTSTVAEQGVITGSYNLSHWGGGVYVVPKGFNGNLPVSLC